MSAQPSLFDLIERRLREHYASTLPQNVGYPGAVKNAILGGINLPFEAGRHIGGDITGSLYAMSAQDTRATNPLDARIAAAYARGGPAAAFEAARTDPRKEVSLTAGAIGMLTDPTMLVGGPLGKLGRVGEIADTVLSTPFKPLEVALGQVGRRAIAPAVLRARQALYGPVEGVAGNVPKSAGLIGPVPPPPLRAPPPLVPGATSILDLARGGVPPAEVAKIAPLPEALAPTRAPGLVREAAAAIPTLALHGPELPPVRALASEQLREALGNLAARRMTSPPPEAVTLAQERALRPEVVSEPISARPVAPSPPTSAPRGIPEGATPGAVLGDTGYAAPAADRAAALAGLSGRDTNTLLNIAYDHPRAVENAQRKYADVGALRARAIERIQLDADRVRRLAAADPDLAARVEALPDAEASIAAPAAIAPEKGAQRAGGARPAGVGEAAGGGGGMMLVTPLAAPMEAARVLGPGAAEAAGQALSNLGLTGTDLRAAGRAGVERMRAARLSEAQGIATPAQATAAGVDRYTRGARGPVEAVNDYLNQQRSVIVATGKNQFLDVAHTRGMLREFAPNGSDPAGTGARILDELRANEGAADAYGKLSDTARTTLEGWGFKGFLPDLGQGQVGALAQEEPGRILPATQRVINGMVMEFRTKGPVGLLTFPAGGARGYFAPFLDAFFERLNRLPQRAGRETLYTLTGDANSFLAAHNFLGSLAQRGVDVTTLAGRRFTPEDVEALAGTQAANEWRSLLATVWGGAEAETKRVLGDFGQKTALEKVPLIGRMFWLAGWSQRMLPVYAQVAARHPGVSMAAGGALANQAQGLKEQGLNPWDVGGVDTPLGRVNLLSPMPFSGELAGEALSSLSGGEPGEAKTPYQTFEGIAGGLGLPINPLVGTAAYIAGQSPRRPGDLDRYAGVENAVLPGPDVGIDYGAMLDKARQIATGLGAGDLAAGKKPSASEADKEFARLVFERTGLPLSDPRNIGAVIDSLADDPDTLAAKWREEAEENVKGRQGRQGVLSAVSPLTVSRIDPLQRAAAIGRTNQPYSYEQISAAYDAGQKKVAQAMTKANAASKAPNQRVYDAASEGQRAALAKSWLTAITNPPRVPLETNAYNLRRTGGVTDLSGLRRR